MEAEVRQSDYCKDVMKEYKIRCLRSKSSKQKEYMTNEWVNFIIERILFAESIVAKQGEKFLLEHMKDTLRTYALKENGTSMSLLVKGDTNKTIIPLEISYDQIKQAHLQTSHGNVKDMQDWLESNNLLVHKLCSEVYVKMCPTCSAQKSDENLDNHNKAIQIYTINDDDEPDIQTPSTLTDKESDVFTTSFCKETPLHICSIDILNFSNKPDQLYKYLLIHQDRKTKFIQLRPMTSIFETEISVEVIKILMDFNCAECMVVHADNIPIFQSVCEKVKALTGCVIALAAHKTQNKLIRIVAKNIAKWMETVKCQSWATGSHIVQWAMNTVPDGDGNTPYSKMFYYRYTGNMYKSRFSLSFNENLDEAVIFDSDAEVKE